MAATTTSFENPADSTSKIAVYIGRGLSALIVVFMLFDGIMKVIKEPHVLQASADLGFNPDMIAVIGAILLTCTVLFAIPRTSVIGAMLLTGYMGGAVVTQMRVGHPLFECLFPVIFGVFVWGSLWLRNGRVRAVVRG